MEVDLSDTLSVAAVRRFELLPGRRLRVRDRLTGLEPGAQIRWGLPTRAAIEITEDRVLLRQSGKLLPIHFRFDPAAELTAESWDQHHPPWQMPVPGTGMLAATVTADEGGTIEIEAIFGGNPDRTASEPNDHANEKQSDSK